MRNIEVLRRSMLPAVELRAARGRPDHSGPRLCAVETLARARKLVHACAHEPMTGLRPYRSRAPEGFGRLRTARIAIAFSIERQGRLRCSC